MVLGEVLVSNPIAPIAWVGPLSKMEVNEVPLLVLSQTPPEAAPATMLPLASAATEVRRPVMATAVPRTTPVKLAASIIGSGPIRLQAGAKPGKLASAPLKSPLIGASVDAMKSRDR